MPNMTTIRSEIKKLNPKQAIWNISKSDLEKILNNLRTALDDDIGTLENEMTEDYKDYYKDFIMVQFKKEIKKYGRGSVKRGQNLIIYHNMMRKHGTILISKDREFYTSL